MKPVARESLSKLIAIIGLMPVAMLVRHCFALATIETTVEQRLLRNQTADSPWIPLSLIVLCAGLYLHHVDARSWRRRYWLLMLGCLIIAGGIGNYAVIYALPALLAVFMWPTSKLRYCLMGCLLPMLLYAMFVMGSVPGTMGASQVKADLRAMGTALEAYYVDCKSYPASTTIGPYGLWQSVEAMPSFAGGSGVAGLTTPVAYLTSYFQDPFRKLSDHRTFAYYCNGPTWIMISAGPDCRFDIPPDRLALLLAAPHLPNDELTNYTYDPTNGMYSAGDIWRPKQ